MTIRKRLTAADQRLLRRVTAGDGQALGRAMLGLGRAADHGALWIAVAAGLGSRRDKWTRRAALRGPRPSPRAMPRPPQAISLVKRPKKLLVYRPQAGD